MMLLREIISNNSFLEKELGKINSLFLNLQISGITSKMTIFLQTQVSFF